MQGIIAGLSREKFEVVIFAIAGVSRMVCVSDGNGSVKMTAKSQSPGPMMLTGGSARGLISMHFDVV